MAGTQLFETGRTTVLREYGESGKRFRSTTKPYKSKMQLVWTVVDAQPGGGVTMAMAELRTPQILEFFGFGLDSQVPYADTTRTAIESDTNQEKGRNTQGQEDFVIEGFSLSQDGLRVQYAGNVYTGTSPASIAAHIGRAALYDPSALTAPPQCYSPFMLNEPFLAAIRGKATFEIEWNRSRTDKLGTIDEVPEGAAKALVFSNGWAANENRYKIPEGYIWRRRGQPDDSMVVRLVVREPIVVPISLIAPNGGVTNATPQFIYQDLTMRAHGLACFVDSDN